MSEKLNFRMLGNTRARAWFLQALVLLVLAVAIIYGLYNVGQNMQKAGVTTGFGFLKEPAGFDISQTLITYSSKSTYARALLVGILNTLLVSMLAILASTFLGFFLGIIRLSPNWLLARMAEAYMEIVRNIPLLLQVLFWYLAILAPLPGPRLALNFNNWIFLSNRGLQIPVPHINSGFVLFCVFLFLALLVSFSLYGWSKRRQQVTGKRFPVLLIALLLLLGLPALAIVVTGNTIEWDIPVLQGFNFKGGVTVLPELISLWLAITLYAAAFIGEFVRSGILAVNRGQREAAFALGHRPWMTYRLIIIPQAMRVVTPPLINQYLTIVKNSSLAIVIGYPDLVHVFAGTALNQSGQAVEIISITMAVYLLISLVISFLMNWYNQKIALKGVYR